MKPIAFLVAATIISVSLMVPTCVQVECAEWNTPGFFKSVGVSDVTRCLQAGADPNARSEYGATPLHTAAMFGTVEVVGALLEVGADPNARGEGGQSALQMAAAFGTVEVVAALLDAGADLNARSIRRDRREARA